MLHVLYLMTTYASALMHFGMLLLIYFTYLCQRCCCFNGLSTFNFYNAATSAGLNALAAIFQHYLMRDCIAGLILFDFRYRLLPHIHIFTISLREFSDIFCFYIEMRARDFSDIYVI